MTPEQQDLAVRYLPLAFSLARPLGRAFPWLADEFDSAAQFGLVQAALVFDPARGVRFATFACYRIVGALLDVQRNVRPRGYRYVRSRKRRLFPARSVAHDRGRVVTCWPQKPVGADMEAREEVEAWLRTLPKRKAEICRRVYLEGHDRRDIARVLRCTQSRLSWLALEALRSLRRRSRVKEAYAQRMGGLARRTLLVSNTRPLSVLLPAIAPVARPLAI